MLRRKITIPNESPISIEDYQIFIRNAYFAMSKFPQYFAPGEGIDALELAHLIPSIPETIIALYVGINDVICNKGIVSPFLIQHGHNNVFVFDPTVYSGEKEVPSGTIDVKTILNGFQPPNETWSPDWTYVMIDDSATTPQTLWEEEGYIDMIPAKFEDFTLLTDLSESKICFFIDQKALKHPVNKRREYLKEALRRGEETEDEYEIPKGLQREVEGLTPIVLEKGQKIYVATPDFTSCAHAWINLHQDNNSNSYAVVNENSAVPLELIMAKPSVKPKYGDLRPPFGSADMTTDWFKSGRKVYRKPLLESLFIG